MRRLLQSRLPERLAGRFPLWLVQAAVGIATALAFLALRVALAPLTGDIAPYALSFLAVVLACVLAGWRSGALALALGQGLTWYLLVPPVGTLGLKEPAAGYSFLLATMSQVLILLVITVYQRAADAAEAERERRIDFLGDALREIDHRTHNNFQTIMSLLLLQAHQASDPTVRTALKDAADRLKAVSLAYQKLAVSSEGLQTVRLQDHLQELCDQLGDGILPGTIVLNTDLDPIVVSYETAACLGIIVNELVTNAVKHAFPHARGTIRVSLAVTGDQAILEVADDGCGLGKTSGRSGLGSRLIPVFANRLDARHETHSSATGTTHRLLMTLAAIQEQRRRVRRGLAKAPASGLRSSMTMVLEPRSPSRFRRRTRRPRRVSLGWHCEVAGAGKARKRSSFRRRRQTAGRCQSAVPPQMSRATSSRYSRCAP